MLQKGKNPLSPPIGNHSFWRRFNSFPGVVFSLLRLLHTSTKIVLSLFVINQLRTNSFPKLVSSLPSAKVPKMIINKLQFQELNLDEPWWIKTEFIKNVPWITTVIWHTPSSCTSDSWNRYWTTWPWVKCTISIISSLVKQK